MASTDHTIMLLPDVVGQLRKLNAGSIRDRLREAEEAKRAEQIALQGETQEIQQETIVSSTEDFRRRFIAGQAKTLVDSNITKTAEGKKNSERNRLLVNIDEKLGSPLKTQPGEEEKAVLVRLGGKLEVFDTGTHSRLSQLISMNDTWFALQKQWHNTNKRDEEEARKEAINLQKKSILGPTGEPVRDPAGNLDLNDPSGSTGAGVGIGAAASVIALKAWKWSKLKAVAFLAWGKKIFSKFKLTSKQTKMLVNPRKWPLVLAGVLAAGFLSKMAFAGDEGEDEAGSEVLPGDLEDLPEQSTFASNMDILFTTAAAGSIIKKSKLVQRVATSVGTKVTAAYKAAPKSSLRGKLYANAGFKKGLSLTGRGLLRFMGPWGMGAWIAWELSSFALKKFSNQEKEGEEALKEIEDLQMQNVDSVLGDPDLEAMFSDPSGPRNFAGAAKKGAIKQRIRALMEGKSIEQKAALKKELMTLGWTASELSPLMGSTSTYSPLNRNRDGLLSKLEVQEKEKTTAFGMSPGAMGGVINSGNSVVGDTIHTIHNYIQGNPGGGSAFEGRKGYMPGQ